MDTQQDNERLRRRRQGQTLAEFAITLPILLILMFGIIEFGRIFQAWVTLQNAARTAARYASTGGWDESKYTMNLDLNLTVKADPDSLVPCVNDAVGANVGKPQYDWPGGDQRGVLATYKGIQIYQGGLESIFATWNNGKNCDPFDANDQEKRRDMARILSIMDKAREGAAGLAIEQNYLTVPADKTSPVGQPWYSVWDNPQLRSDQRSWFDVTICSTRKLLDDQNSKTYYQNEGGRFVTYLGDRSLRDPGGVDHSSPGDLYAPGCYLNEIPTSGTEVQNAGKPWADPGGPADTVVVIVSFNHPLITPLGLTNYIPMQARRTAIVEAFRAVDPRNALGSSPTVGLGVPTETFTPSDTPTDTPTVTPSESPTPKPAPSPTNTQPGPFDCSLLSADSLFISGGQVFIALHNQNVDATHLTRVIFRWPSIYQYDGQNGMFLFEMALDQAPHWRGKSNSNPYPGQNTTDTNTDSYLANTLEIDRTIAGTSTGDWSATFSNGPTNMQLVSTINDYAATFYMYDPLHPSTPCVVPLITPTPTPVPTIDPNKPSNTPTYTPDCASSLISVTFVGFEPFGLVHLQVKNGRRAVSPLTDFSISWIQRAAGILTLDRVTTVAPYGEPGSFEVWNGGDPAQDGNPATKGHNDASNSKGTWVSNFNFPAATSSGPSITDMYIDFGGVTGYLDDIGVSPTDFNGTQFNIGCSTTGGTTNGPTGGTTGGLITLSSIPTVTPTGTKGPTNTPAPTNTPKPTVPSPTPSKTYTPGPTATPLPATKTFTPTPTKTPAPPPTLPGGGCTDSCK
jgi:TadE-like protein